MFRLMLNRHHAFHVPGETWFLTEVLDRFPSQGPLTPEQVTGVSNLIHEHWRWKEWGMDESVSRAAVQALSEPTLADVVDTIYRVPMADAGKRRWIDKTPGYTTEIPRLHRLFPEAKFVHVIRDGRDVVISLRRTGWHGQKSWNIAEYWATAVSTARRDAGALATHQYLEVSYERLVLETEAALREVCDFLGEAFDPAMLEFHDTADDHIPDRATPHLSKTFRPPRESDVQRWRHEMGYYHRVTTEAMAGATLEDVGYERSVNMPLGWVRAVCRGLDEAAVMTLPLRRRLGLHFPQGRKKL